MGNVIRSLGEDARIALVEGRTHGRARMVTMSRRKRMVAHNIADTPAFLAVMVRRRPFFQETPLTNIMPPDKVEVEPCIVVAALIIRAQAQGIARDRESTMKAHQPLSIGFRPFKKPTNVSPIARNRSGSPQWCGAGRHRQKAVSKGFFDSTDVVPVVALPCSTVEVTSNQVHIFCQTSQHEL